MRAFGTLGRSRSVGFGAGPIMLSEICVYYDRIGRIGGIEEFVTVIQALDQVYLEAQSEKNKGK